MPSEPVSFPPANGPLSSGPLAGVTVIDLTRVLAGPYATMVLADLGARVIKVEQPGSGDDSRGFGPIVDGVSSYFVAVNRAKESIALDLKAKADLEILHALLARADVVVENFRPGVMERLGLDWARLSQRYPRLIFASVSGFGQDGPYRDQAAYDIVVQAMSGLMGLTGENGGTPMRVGTSIGDIAAGLFLSNGITAALYDRERTGRGRFVDVAMLDSQVALLENVITRHAMTGELPVATAHRHPLIAPFQAFRTADTRIVIAAGNDRMFARLARALGRDDLPGDPRFSSREGRRANVLALESEIETILMLQPAHHWLALLLDAGVPCGPINAAPDVLSDPQLAARNMIVSLGNPDGPLAAGNPIKMSGVADPAVRPAAPRLDGDRVRILAELGISDTADACEL